MRELALRIDAARLEPVLDALLPLAPRGVHDVELPSGELELRLRGAAEELPPRVQVVRALGQDVRAIVEREVSDDWRERRVHDYVELVIGGRLVLRPEWAPPPVDDLIDVAVPDAASFGRGGHPTTRACLEALLELAPGGAFADLGCGSGVLAVAAARLGYEPVFALDVETLAVETASAAAALNGVEIDVRLADLLEHAPPAADTVAANMPAAVHAASAAMLESVPRVLLACGIHQDEVAEVLAAYGERGLRPARPVATDVEWPLILLAPAAALGPGAPRRR